MSAENTAGYPSLTVEQGGTGSGVNTPGQVEVVWDNFATATGISATTGSLAIETRGFIPTQNLPTPGATPPAGTFVSAEVAAFTSIPTNTVTNNSGFVVLPGCRGRLPTFPTTR